MNSKLFICILFGVIALSSCKLKRPSLKEGEFPGKVSPTIACQGQNITIEWDGAFINAACANNGAACKRDPLTVEVTGSGGIEFKESPAPLSGNHNSVISGTQDAEISFHAFDTDQDLGTAKVKINVLSANEMLNFDAVCEGICEGDNPAWKEMKVDFKEESLSEFIAIKQIKNTNAFDIELTVSYQNGETSSANLKAGQTSSMFTSRVSKINSRNKSEVNACSKGSAPPAAIKLQVNYGCL